MANEDRDDNEMEGEGIFDEDDNLFTDDEEGHDEKDGQEGVFRDPDSIFATPHDAPVNHNNPLTTKQQEDARYEIPVETSGAPVQGAKGKKQLVVKFVGPNNDQPVVAHHLNGRALERFRYPSKDEFWKIKHKARLVKGGVGDVPATQPAATGLTLKKVAIYGGGLAAAGLAGWWLWKKYKDSTDDGAEVDEVSG